MNQTEGEFWIGVATLIGLGIPALFALRNALRLAVWEANPANPWRLSFSFRFLDLAAVVGIGFLYLIGLATATNILIWTGVALKEALSILLFN